jgi:hypothetical protein
MVAANKKYLNKKAGCPKIPTSGQPSNMWSIIYPTGNEQLLGTAARNLPVSVTDALCEYEA